MASYHTLKNSQGQIPSSALGSLNNLKNSKIGSNAPYKAFHYKPTMHENLEALKQALSYLLKNLKFKSYLSHNTIKEKLAINIPYLLDLRDKRLDFESMSKYDKLFIMNESMNVLKEKEILRLIKNYKSKPSISKK